MQLRHFAFLIPLILLFCIDFYAFQAIKTITIKKSIYFLYWLVSISILITFAALLLLNFQTPQFPYKSYISGIFFVCFLFKFILILFVGIDDLIRLFRWGASFFYTHSNPDNSHVEKTTITRSQFLLQLGTLAASIPSIAFLQAMLRGSIFDYKLNKIKLPIANLPDAFEGLKIIQISDIHSGSFSDVKPIQKAIDIINAQNPDLVFFTGDLVNYAAKEALSVVNIFKQITAKFGVHSITGNHDYGDYYNWENEQQKQQNFELLKQIHQQLGWNLMLNTNHIIEKQGSTLAIIGVENWSAHNRFPKYGNLEQAYKGTENANVKLLLSHDPSHWHAEVLPKYPKIAAMFAGHTHGLQFGINFKGFKWSPVQYSYKEWAGLYTQNNQHLYVNTGFGYLAIPSRVGFLPEITLFELTKV